LGGELAGVQPLQGPAGLGSYQAGVWLAARASDTLEPALLAAALAVHAFALIVALGAAALAQLIAIAPLNASPASPTP
jgi:voltage-gated potassium channel Kch